MGSWHLDYGPTIHAMLLASLWLAGIVACSLVVLRLVGADKYHRYQHGVARAALWTFAGSMVAFAVALNLAAAPRLIVNDPTADRAWLLSLVQSYETLRVGVEGHPVAARLATWIAIGWLLGVLAALTKLTRSYLGLRDVLRTARPVSVDALLRESSAALRGRIHQRRIRILVSDRVCQPGTVGFGQPSILLPVGIEELLRPSEMAAIVAHEVAHIDRGDFPKNVGLQVVRALLWFNPGFHMVARIYESGRELACDRAALAYGISPAAMARALARLSVSGLPIGRSLGVFGTGGSIVQRIEVLVEGSLSPRGRRLWLPLAVTTIMLSSGLGVASARAAVDAWGLFRARAGYLTQLGRLDLDELTYDVCVLLQREGVVDPDRYGSPNGPVTLTFDAAEMILNGRPVPRRVQRSLAQVLDKHSVKRSDENFLRFYQSDSELGVRSGAVTFGERIGTGHWLRTIPRRW